MSKKKLLPVPPKKLVRHHRHPRSRRDSYKGKINDAENIAFVDEALHVAYHQVFKNMLPKEMASLLNATWVSPDWYLIAVPRKKNRKSKWKQKKTVYKCTECGSFDIERTPLEEIVDKKQLKLL